MLDKPKAFDHKTMYIDVTLKDLEIYYFQQPVLRLINYLNIQLLPSLTPEKDENVQSGNAKTDKKKVEEKKSIINE